MVPQRLFHIFITALSIVVAPKLKNNPEVPTINNENSGMFHIEGIPLRKNMIIQQYGGISKY